MAGGGRAARYVGGMQKAERKFSLLYGLTSQYQSYFISCCQSAFSTILLVADLGATPTRGVGRPFATTKTESRCRVQIEAKCYCYVCFLDRLMAPVQAGAASLRCRFPCSVLYTPASMRTEGQGPWRNWQ